MKVSELFANIGKEDLEGIKSKSHNLLAKAGYIKRSSVDKFSLLPMGYKVYKNLVDIIQEEWSNVGAQEIISDDLQGEKLIKLIKGSVKPDLVVHQIYRDISAGCSTSKAYSFHNSPEDISDISAVYSKIFTRIGVSRIVEIPTSKTFSKDYVMLNSKGDENLYVCHVCGFKCYDKDVVGVKKCPKCGAPLLRENGIKLASITLIEEGSVLCYDMNVDKTMHAMAVEKCDDRGLNWPVSVSPFGVILTTTTMNNELSSKAEDIYKTLQDNSINVLYDDRNTKSKLGDAELMGIPLQIIISPKTIEGKALEIKIRDTEESFFIQYGEVISVVQNFIETHV